MASPLTNRNLSLYNVESTLAAWRPNMERKSAYHANVSVILLTIGVLECFDLHPSMWRFNLQKKSRRKKALTRLSKREKSKTKMIA